MNKDLFLQDDLQTAFMKSAKGKVCIALSDPAYVRSDLILLDRRDNSVHAVLHESSHFLGHLTEGMANAFVDNKEILLCAVHTNGGIFELKSPLAVTGR